MSNIYAAYWTEEFLENAKAMLFKISSIIIMLRQSNFVFWRFVIAFLFPAQNIHTNDINTAILNLPFETTYIRCNIWNHHNDACFDLILFESSECISHNICISKEGKNDKNYGLTSIICVSYDPSNEHKMTNIRMLDMLLLLY